MSLGVLTLATPRDYRKAIGLALSVRTSNPGVPIAVACSMRVRPLVTPYFDHVVDEDPSLSGFMHKLHLDRYSPFDETFFFDSDVIVFRPLSEVVAAWRGQSYTACGEYKTGGKSAFGLDRGLVIQSLGVERLVHVDGAGHAYFRKPDCHSVFDLARKVALDYQKYGGENVRFCDEDVIAITMTMLNLRPMPRTEFWSRYCSGTVGSMRIDAARGMCQFELAVSPGRQQRPYIMHFAANEVPFAYFSQLRKLFRKYEASTSGLLLMTVNDFLVSKVRWPLGWTAKRLLRSFRSLGAQFSLIGGRQRSLGSG